jgi:hypothetical protein
VDVKLNREYGSNPSRRTLLSGLPGPLTEFFLRDQSVRGAPSPSGKAEVCKTSIPGSNPGGASKIH